MNEPEMAKQCAINKATYIRVIAQLETKPHGNMQSNNKLAARPN